MTPFGDDREKHSLAVEGFLPRQRVKHQAYSVLWDLFYSIGASACNITFLLCLWFCQLGSVAARNAARYDPDMYATRSRRARASVVRQENAVDGRDR